MKDIPFFWEVTMIIGMGLFYVSQDQKNDALIFICCGFSVLFTSFFFKKDRTKKIMNKQLYIRKHVL